MRVEQNFDRSNDAFYNGVEKWVEILKLELRNRRPRIVIFFEFSQTELMKL